MLYGMARRYDDLRGEAPDGGSSLRGALKGWFKHGVCKQALWPKLDEPVPTSKPDWWDDGVRRPLGAYYRVDSRSVVDMQVALNETGVLLASALASAGWDDGDTRKGGKKAAPNGIWTIPYPRPTKSTDGHAFAIVGYDEDGFIVQNSWGDGWGTHGLAILTYEDWIKHGYDCWVAQLGVVTRRHEAQATGDARISATRFGASGSTLLDLNALSPYVVNTGHNGELSPSGEFHTTYQDLEELANVLLPSKRDRMEHSGGIAHRRGDLRARRARRRTGCGRVGQGMGEALHRRQGVSDLPHLGIGPTVHPERPGAERTQESRRHPDRWLGQHDRRRLERPG